MYFKKKKSIFPIEMYSLSMLSYFKSVIAKCNFYLMLDCIFFLVTTHASRLHVTSAKKK